MLIYGYLPIYYLPIFPGMKTTFFLTLVFWTFLGIFAQYEDYRYGLISDEERSFERVPGHPDAAAYLLFDRLEVNMTLSAVTGQLELRQTVTRRIKLFEDSAFYLANVTVDYFEEEEIGRFKAAIHYADGGSIELDNSDLSFSELEAGILACKFSFPAVETGSIIEYTYEIRSDFFSIDKLPIHYFQEDIPCRWSEYVLIKPLDFNYIDLGLLPEFDVIEYQEIPRSNGFFGDAVLMFSYDRYVLKDVPPVVIEPHVNNLQDYMPRINKHISFVNWQNIFFDAQTYTWSYIANKIRGGGAWRNINLRARGNRFLKDIEPLLEGAETDMEKAQLIYRLLNDRMGWDGKYDYLSYESPNRIWAKGAGNSAEINGILLYALRQLGIDVRPVLVRLRGSGHHLVDHPDLSQFNHMLVYAAMDGEERLLDMAGHTLPFGYVRPLALNNDGWMIGDETTDWIGIQAPIARETLEADIELDENGVANINAQTSSGGYFGVFARDNMLSSSLNATARPFFERISDQYPEFVLIDENLPFADDPDQPYLYAFNIQLQLAEIAGYEMSFKPILYNYVDFDILADTIRTYPVDFPFGYQKQYASTISIPIGYEVVTLPKDVVYNSEDGSVKLLFNTEIVQNKLSIQLDIQILRTQFSAVEYDVLWQLFQKIQALQNSTIVLTKTTLERP